MKLSKTSLTCQINPKKYYLMCLSINQSHNWIEKETGEKQERTQETTILYSM